MAKQNMRNVESNIGIIVTRPSGQSQSFINRIKKKGYTPFDLPGIMIVPARYQKSAIEMMNNASKYDYLLFTSPNSVRFAKRLKLNFQEVNGFISIGSGTEKALKPYVKGKESIIAAKPYTSEALVETLKTRGIEGKSVLIISGEGGRRLLDSAINDLGGTGEYCDVYRREVPESYNIDPILAFKSQKNAKRSLYLTISSQEAFMNLLPTLESNGLKPLIDGVFVGSDRLKNIVEAEGFKNIIVARSALENDLWQSIVATLDTSNPPSVISPDNDKELSMTQEQKKNELNAADNISKPQDDSAKENTKDLSNESSETISSSEEVTVSKTPRTRNNPAKNRRIKSAESAEQTATTHTPKDAADHNDKERTDSTTSEKVEATTAEKTKDTSSPKVEKVSQVGANTHNEHPQSSEKKPNQSLSYVAIILALGGFALGGLAYYQSAELKSQLAGFSTTLQTENSSVASLSNEISTLKSDIDALKTAASDVTLGADDASLKSQISFIAQKHESLNSTLSDSAKGLQQQIDALKAAQEKFAAQNQEIDTIAKVSNQAITIANDFDKKLAAQQLSQSVVLDEAKQLISTIKNITDLEMLRTTEVDYLLKTAIQKVQYDKDYKTAAGILTSALDRIAQINSVNFTETKNLIETNITELNNLQPVNLVDIANRLDKVTSLVQQAPLKSDSALETLKNEVFNQQTPEGETWTDTLTNSLKHLIVIEDKRVEAPELMAKEDRFFLLQNIQLELTAAKVAILQDQYAIFKQSLTTVQSWIKTYFDADNADVREAIAQVQWLLDAQVDVTPPNIERTLTDFEATLRAYKGVQQ